MIIFNKLKLKIQISIQIQARNSNSKHAYIYICAFTGMAMYIWPEQIKCIDVKLKIPSDQYQYFIYIPTLTVCLVDAYVDGPGPRRFAIGAAWPTHMIATYTYACICIYIYMHPLRIERGHLWHMHAYIYMYIYSQISIQIYIDLDLEI